MVLRKRRPGMLLGKFVSHPQHAPGGAGPILPAFAHRSEHGYGCSFPAGKPAAPREPIPEPIFDLFSARMVARSILLTLPAEVQNG